LRLPDAVQSKVDRNYAVEALAARLSHSPLYGGPLSLTHRARSLARPIAFSLVSIVLGTAIAIATQPERLLLGGLLTIMGVITAPFLVLCLLEWRRSDLYSSTIRAVCARLLGAFKEICTLPALAAGLHDVEYTVSFECRQALIRLLPKVSQLPDYHLGSASEPIGRWLNQASREQSKIILKALRDCGSGSALPEVEIFAASCGSVEMKELADQTLEALRKRLEEAKQRSTLLRPSAPDDEPLLRPSVAIACVEVQMLLRPSISE